eukprot:TRINITY_DN11148_c0_g1_i1.p1 TRINITY_DN11148_c0_g1~~TRINITY_DN11148_c0_g1_i1.p1  ORF type:complete len:722 (+),score=161.02 TRINITY_DN11148_c0_g1_i1:173-2338(+)
MSALESDCLLEGWLRKRGRHLLQWHWRFVRITTTGRLLTFTDPRCVTITDDVDIRGSTAEASTFTNVISENLPFGIALTSQSGTMLLAAKSEVEQEVWLQILSEAAAASGEAPHKPRSRSGSFSSAQKTPEPSAADLAAKSKSAPPPPAAKAAGKAKGKGAPPPPPPKGKGKGKKGKGAQSAARTADALPIGRRLTLRTLADKSAVEAFAAVVAAGPEGDGTLKTSPRLVDPTAVDLDALKSAFAPAPKAAAAGGGGGRRGSDAGLRARPSKAAAVELLPRDVAQNIAIIFKKMRVDTVAMAAALDRLAPEACAFTADEAERLIHALPSLEMLHKLAAYGDGEHGDDPSLLRDVERQLLPLASLSRLTQRLRLLSLAKTLETRLSDAVTQLSLVQAACSAVRSSGLFRDLLQVVVVVFNYVNFGDAPLPADGDAEHSSTTHNVDVQSLMRLKDTQAYDGPFPRYNMLHFCLDQLLQQRQESSRGEFEEELRVVSDAAGVSLVQSHNALSQLREELAFVRNELTGHREHYEPAVFEASGTVALPEPLPAEVEAETGPLEFSMLSDEGAKEEQCDVTRTESETRRGFFAHIAGLFVDSLSFLEQWREGTAVWGLANPCSEAIMHEDGVPPPPGMLRRLRPSGEVRRYWCEVRASLLVMYRIEGTQIYGTMSYVTLPGAEVWHLNSLYASEHARALADHYAHGLERARAAAARPSTSSRRALPR